MIALRLLPLAGCLALAACGSAAGPHDGTEVLGPVPGAAFTPRPVPAGRAFVLLPPEAGAVVAIGERRYANGATQVVTLAGEAGGVGENAVEIGLRTAPPRTVYSEDAPKEVPMVRPTDEAIAAELSAGFPGVPMAIADEDAANAHGPFGYAAGRAPSGQTCVYAWQWVEDVDGAPGRGGWFGGARRPASVRVRLCRAATERRIVGWLREMRLRVDGEGRTVAPVGLAAAAGAPDALGTASARAGFAEAPPPAADAEETAPPRRRLTAAVAGRAPARRERSPAAAPPAAAPRGAAAVVDPGRYAVVPAPR